MVSASLPPQPEHEVPGAEPDIEELQRQLPDGEAFPQGHDASGLPVVAAPIAVPEEPYADPEALDRAAGIIARSEHEKAADAVLNSSLMNTRNGLKLAGVVSFAGVAAWVHNKFAGRKQQG